MARRSSGASTAGLRRRCGKTATLRMIIGPKGMSDGRLRPLDGASTARIA